MITGAETFKAGSKYKNPAYRWYVVSLLGITYMVSYIDRLIISLMVDPIKADLALSDTQISLLIGLSFALFYTTSAIPIAWLADRFNRRNIIVSGVTVWCLMTAVCGFAKTFPALFVARMGVGLGEAALAPAGNSLIADSFPKEQLGRALGIFTSGIAIGAGLALVIGGHVLALIGPQKIYDLPVLGTLSGWQLALVMLGVAGLVVAAALMTIEEPARKRDPDQSEGAPAASLKETLAYFLEHRRVYATLFLAYSAAQTGFYALGGWVPSLFLRVYKWDISFFGTAYGSMTAIAGVAGVMAGGLLCDRFFKKGVIDSHWRVITWALCLMPAYVLIPVAPNGGILMVILAIGSLSAFAMAAAAPAAIIMITPNRYRAMATALFFFTINITGMILGPYLVATLTQNVFKDPNSIGLALAIVCGVGFVVAMAILLTGHKPYRKRVEERLAQAQ